MADILCLNGPNLNLLGRRQPEVYGSDSLAALEQRVVDWGKRLGLSVTCHQFASEADLITAIHGANDVDGIVLNPGALTHTSWALHDAIRGVEVPVVEVHLSNVRGRDRWRRRSVIAPAAIATIFGRGAEGYRAALRVLVNHAAWPVETHRYGPHPDQVLDVRRSGEDTAIVLIHGGFWLDTWGRDTVESWAVDLARRGISTINLEFRRLGSGGGALATTRDVVEGIKAGAALLGTDPVAIVGHSAGAHLGAWAVGGGGIEVDRFIGVAGIYDLAAAMATGVGEGAIGRFDPDFRTSPTAGRIPATEVALVHGSDDPLVPIDQSRRYRTVLSSAGTAVELMTVPDTAHFEVLDPDHQGWQNVLEVMNLV